MKISELQPKTGDVELVATITEIGEIREFEKAGGKGRVAKATIKDETGECKLTLWNEQIDQVKVGSKIKITKGWADEWRDEMQISTGKFGSLEVLEHNATIEEATYPKEEKETGVSEEEVYSDEDEVVFDADKDDII